jgi:hypothetical protein
MALSVKESKGTPEGEYRSRVNVLRRELLNLRLILYGSEESSVGRVTCRGVKSR